MHLKKLNSIHFTWTKNMKVNWKNKSESSMMTKMVKLSPSKLLITMITRNLEKMMKETKLLSSKSREKESKERMQLKKK